MIFGRKKTTSESPDILELLNQALQLEYTLVVYYPRIASTISHVKARELVLSLGTASVKHADIIANTISSLGGDPAWSFEPFPAGTDPVRIFRKQLEKERQALRLHEKSASLIRDRSLKMKFTQLATDEEKHIETVEGILSRL